ncbi:CPBP family intramembrane glutamic endopeptidase [Pseudobutyrivibrio sp.]|uniref:CPBP family intramembrane glutamic endopeptidase n=1 Tax=Pseudobutyrivibrio sp. TaxID=2014367 RepID=UPI00386B790A
MKNQLTRTIFICLFSYLGYLLFSVLGDFIAVKALEPDTDIYCLATIVGLFRLLFLLGLLFIIKKTSVLTNKGNGFFGGLVSGGYTIFSVIAASILILFTDYLETGVYNFKLPEKFYFGPTQIYLILAITISAGICEELLFRGIILNTLREYLGKDSFKGTVIAIIISSFVFGALHLTNILSGVSVFAAVLQSITAFAIGIYFGAIYCRWGNIKIVMLLHTLTDLASLLCISMRTNSDFSSSVNNISGNYSQLFTAALYTCIGIFLMRKKVRNQMFTYSI